MVMVQCWYTKYIRHHSRSQRTKQWGKSQVDKQASQKRTWYHISKLLNLSQRPTGQNNLLIIYPHFGIKFFQPPRLLKSENSENITVVRFLSSLLNIIQTFDGQCTYNKKCISSLLGRYPYRNGCLLHFISASVDSKYIGKLMTLCESYSHSRITQFTTFHIIREISSDDNNSQNV